MMKCRKCSVELVVGENITISQIKYKNYMCKPCRKQWNQSAVGKALDKQYRKKWGTKKQGVYGIFSGETCLYVGESSQLNNRISIHKSGIKNPEIRPNHKELYIRISRHDNIQIKVLEETKRHKQREGYYITTLKPLYNEKG